MVILRFVFLCIVILMQLFACDSSLSLKGAVDGGNSCSTSQDCPKEKGFCGYVSGCSSQKQCMSNPCAALLKKYCGCDGVIFEGTSSCPRRPFRELSGSPTDATKCDPATGQILDAGVDSGATDAVVADAGTVVERRPEFAEKEEGSAEGSGEREVEIQKGVKTMTGSLNQSPLAYRSYGIVVDSGAILYITDTLNHRILKIKPSGEVSTFAGSTQGYQDGVGSAAKFYEPHGLAIDKQGNLYICDTNNHRIRKVDSTGKVTTIAGSGNAGSADGIGTSAQFNEPQGITVDQNGNLFVADTLNHRIRKIDRAGKVTTIAGSTQGYRDGQGGAAQFNFVFGIVIDKNNMLYIADAFNHKIRKVDLTGKVTTLAGSGNAGRKDGLGITAEFDQPHGLTMDQSGNLYIADMQNHRIRKLAPDGQVSTIAGSIQGLKDGANNTAQFNKPYALTFVPGFGLYVADTYNYRIRTVRLNP